MAFNSSQPGDSILEGYLRRVRRRPISKKDVTKALQPYGRKFGTAEGKTDAKLYRIATREVIQWFKDKKRRRTRTQARRSSGGTTRRSASTTGSRTVRVRRPAGRG